MSASSERRRAGAISAAALVTGVSPFRLARLLRPQRVWLLPQTLYATAAFRTIRKSRSILVKAASQRAGGRKGVADSSKGPVQKKRPEDASFPDRVCSCSQTIFLRFQRAWLRLPRLFA
jgi:hypothetical protein